jgi:tetratricopeptide (TPR) repeat protein
MPRLRGHVLALSLALTALPSAAQDIERPAELPATRRPAGEADRQRARALYGEALVHQNNDRLLEATRLLEEAVRLDPAAVAHRKALLPLYHALGRVDDVMTTCKAVLDRAPDDAPTWRFYGRYLKEQGRPAEAADALERGLRGDLDERPVLHVNMLADLAALRAQTGPPEKSAAAHGALADALMKHQAELVEAHVGTNADIAGNAADAATTRGRALAELKRFDEAQAAFDRARRLCEAEPDLRGSLRAGQIDWHLALVERARGRGEAALRALDRYLAQRPQNAEAYEAEVELLTGLGRGQAALEKVRRRAGLDPNFLPLQLLLARELARGGRGGEAEELYEHLSRTHAVPELYRGWFGLYRTQRRAADVLALLDAALTTAGDDNQLADARSAAADRGTAMLTVLRTDPGLVRELLPVALDARFGRDRKANGDTFRMLAALAARGGELDAAEKLFRACLKAPPPTRDRAADGLVTVLLEARKWAELKELCEQLLRDQGELNRFVYLFHLSLALAELEQDDRAIATADRAVRLAGADDAKAAIRRRRVEVLRRAGRYAEAVAECEALLKEYTQPADVRATRFSLAHVYGSMHEHWKAEELLRQVLAVDPNDATANNDLGYQLADQNRKLPEAESLIRRAIDLDRAQRREQPDDEPDNAAFLDSLGWVLFRRGKLTEAKEWLEKSAALPTGRSDPTVWDHLGDVQYKLGDEAAAREAWSRALAGFAHDVVSRRDGRKAETERKLKLVAE